MTVCFCLTLALMFSAALCDSTPQDSLCMLQVTRLPKIVPPPGIGAPPWGQEMTAQHELAAVRPRLSIALIGAKANVAVASGSSGDQQLPRDPSWFGAPSEVESSTYIFDADSRAHNAHNVEEEALQTNNPVLDDSIAGGSVLRETAAGNLERGYQGTNLGGGNAHQGNLDPGFFDASAPRPQSAKLRLGWQERTVNTTLKCADPGCTANSTLLLFDPATEQVADCHFGLHIHPTDFDDQYSGERLDWIQVSGATVNTDCFPSMHGCSPGAALFTCVQDFPIDSLVNKSSGSLAVAAKISDVVDECPYEDNLLSSIPMVTCMVGPIPATETEPSPLPATVLSIFPETISMEDPETIFKEEPLRCTERGCKAHAMFSINQTAVIFQSCTMSIRVWQTDFDGDEGSAETIEFVKLNGVDLAANVAPGKNPCKSEWLGDHVNDDDRVFAIVTDQDITAQANSQGGRFLVEGKISPLVDECAHSGYLLDGNVSVTCTFRDPEAGGSDAEAEGNAVEDASLSLEGDSR